MNDRRETPAYPLAEAGRYVHVPAATLRSWVRGRPYPKGSETAHFEPLIIAADHKKGILSFNNLIEAHVLRALRTEHGVPIKSVRDAIQFAEKELAIKRLLLSKELRTSAGELFLDRYGQLIQLSPSRQLAMKCLLEVYLQRIEWDEGTFPVRLYPFVRGDEERSKPIVIDPAISFGRPVVAGKFISTSAIADRIDAGETTQEIAQDYSLSEREIQEAVVYERAA